jgi:serine/threonine protein phosphatase PrpC
MPLEDKTALPKTNQDRGCCVFPFAGSATQALFCVFDGHGEHGHWVSEFVMVQMPVCLERELAKRATPEEALKHAFVKVTAMLKKETSIKSAQSGTTGAVVLCRDDHMWVANVGDSRAVVGRKSPVAAHEGRLIAINLTEDQKPDSPVEMARILASGGFISPEDENGPCRVYQTSDLSEGGLTLGRAIGDFSLEKAGVICEPVVSKYQFHQDDQVVVLGSDGVFEFITNQEVVELASQNVSASRACASLVKEAMFRWCPNDAPLYRDDITACIIHPPLWLPEAIPPPL